MIGTETERFSHGQFCLGVETLHHAAGKPSSRMKPVEQEGAMRPQHPSDLLHGVDLGTHGFRAPSIQEPAGPKRGDVAPEELKLLFQEISSDGLEVVLQELGQFHFLGLGEVLRSFQQQPARF